VSAAVFADKEDHDRGHDADRAIDRTMTATVTPSPLRTAITVVSSWLV